MKKFLLLLLITYVTSYTENYFEYQSHKDYVKRVYFNDTTYMDGHEIIHELQYFVFNGIREQLAYSVTKIDGKKQGYQISNGVIDDDNCYDYYAYSYICTHRYYKFSEIQYSNGKQHGYDILYSSNTMQFKHNYKNDKYDGEQLTFHNNGDISAKAYYKNGMIDGIAQSYYKNGQIKRTTFYKNNIIIGDIKWFYPDATIRAVAKSKNNKIYKVIFYNLNGDVDFIEEVRGNIKIACPVDVAGTCVQTRADGTIKYEGMPNNKHCNAFNLNPCNGFNQRLTLDPLDDDPLQSLE